MKITTQSFVAAVAVSLFALVGFAAGQSHPFSVHDMLAMKRISDPQVSPNGSAIVFVVRSTDLKANRGRSDLWMVNADGSGLHRLTSDPASDASPRWLPNGSSILFLSTRSGSSQVWSLPTAGGEAEQVTRLPLNVENLIVAPDGKKIAFTLNVFVDCPSLQCTAKRLEERRKNPRTGEIFDELFVRHWDTWEDGRFSHLFVQSLDGGPPIDMMTDMKSDTPSQPFGGPEEFAFTPDSTSVIFTAKATQGSERVWSTNFDLYLSPVDGSRAPRDLTTANSAWDSSPTFSPDGKTLVYLAMKRPGFESDRFRIVLRSWPGGTDRVLTEDWDRSPSALLFSSDSQSIYATASNLGQTSLFSIDLQSGKVRTLVEKGTVGSVAEAGERVVFGLDNLKSPVELFSVDSAGKQLARITDLNRAELQAARMGDAEQFSFPGWNDEKVYGYVVRPVDFDPSKKYPVAFLIHGGPQGSFSNHFHYRWNPQAYAGAGYAVVMVDFHGSVGYGQAFTDAIRKDWGGKPLEDLQKGLAAALAKFPWIDGSRVGALGASYGGYMINWIAGNWPDRFRCLVVHDGVFDMRSMYFATEELWFPEWEEGGPYWKVPAQYEKHNPADFVQNWKTPMLVIHGGRDFRLPLEQGLSAFTALQRQGIPSRFLYFPDENHWVLKPANSIQWHETVLQWLDRWLK